ncbi:MAG: HAD family hydrolase [Myxococcota bacterium]|jgi:phosphoglycolate phosphatase|nr:HAD family hydrolase [Myxococcota bacterium]
MGSTRTPRAVIFDLDGTLAYTLPAICNAGNAALAELGLEPYPLERYRHFVGDGMPLLVARMMAERGLQERSIVDRCLQRYRSYYEELQFGHSVVYDGVFEMLEALRARHLALAVLSNKPHDFTLSLVQHLFGRMVVADGARGDSARGPFVLVQGLDAQTPRKPSPEAASKIAKVMQLDAADFLFVGDSGTDMETALAAGMVPIGVSWGYRDEQELRARGAAAVLDGPAQLLDFVSACTKEG